MYFDIIIAGFGGQGVMFIGNLLAYLPPWKRAGRSPTCRCTAWK